MRIKGVLFFALIMMALVWPGLTRGADGRDVVFSEIAWAGSSRSSSDEWIELYNSTDVIVDLAGWEIWDVASTPKLLVQFPKGRIASHGRFLVANNEADYLFSAGESALSVQPDIIDSQLALSNSALKLELRRSDETVADLAGMGGAPFNTKTDPLHTLERILDPIELGSLATSWRPAEVSSGFDADILDFGSPENSGEPKVVLPECSPIMWRPGETSRPIPVIPTSMTPTGASLGGGDVELQRTSDDAYQFILPRTNAIGETVTMFTVVSPNGLTTPIAYVCPTRESSVSVRFSEVLSSPNDSQQEFVEIANSGEAPVNLLDWKLSKETTTGSSTFTLPSFNVPPKSLALLPIPSSFTLLNAGMTLTLIDPLSDVAQRIVVPSTARGQSWGVTGVSGDGIWAAMVPTPGLINGIPIQKEKSTLDNQTEELPLIAAVADLAARRVSAGQLVVVEGIISETLGTYKERTLLLSEGESTVEVLLPEDAVSVVVRGSRVRVMGKISSASMPRILASSNEAIQIIDETNFNLDELSGETRIWLLKSVRFEGTVATIDRRQYVDVIGLRIAISVPRSLNLSLNNGDRVRGEAVVSELDPLKIVVTKAEAIEDDIVNLATVNVVEENLLDQDDVISLVNLPQDDLQLAVAEQVTGQAVDASIVARSLLALASGVEKQRAQLSALQVQAATQKSSTLPVTWSLVSVMIATSFVVCLGADWLWEFLTSELLH